MRTTHTNAAAPELPTPYDAVPPHYVTGVPELFRRAGYYCTPDAKTDYQFGEPFTMWDRQHDATRSRSRDDGPGAGPGWWDDARESDQPFFAVFTNGVTHESGQWDPTEPGTDDPVRRVGRGSGDGPRRGRRPAVPTGHRDDPDGHRPPVRQPARSDAWIGEILDRLDADGHAEDTIVVLWSDHGEGLPRAKRWPFTTRGRTSPHRPLARPGRRWRRRRPPREPRRPRPDDALCLWDRRAPVLRRPAILGADGDETGDTSEEREYVVSTRDRYDESYDMVRSVRGERYRYVRHYRPRQALSPVDPLPESPSGDAGDSRTGRGGRPGGCTGMVRRKPASRGSVRPVERPPRDRRTRGGSRTRRRPR